jgi:RHS repeat-associated protein
VSALGGPAPYWQSWTFDTAGNRKTQTTHTSVGNTTATSNYPASGPNSVRPHAVSSITTTGGTTANFSYDSAGNTTGRPGPIAAQTLTWDNENHLGKVTENGKDTTYLYAADGSRIVQSDPQTTTVYLPFEDLTRNKTTGAITATRYYQFGGKTFASITSGGQLNWLISDPQGTQQISIVNGSQAITQRRQDPYGNPRGATTTWPNTRGFVGGTNDTSGLVHEGAREYDAGLGRFISVDPLFDAGDPQSWQGYAYAANSPVTSSDPSGTVRCDQNGDCAVSPRTPIDDNHNSGSSGSSGSGGSSGSSTTTSGHKAPRCNDNGVCTISRRTPLPTSKELMVTVVCVGAGHTCTSDGPPLAIVGVTSFPHGVKLERLSDGRLLIVVPGADPYVLRPNGPNPFDLAKAIDNMFAKGVKNPSRDEDLYKNMPAVYFVSAACAETAGLHCGAAYAGGLDKDYVNFFGGWDAIENAASVAKSVGDWVPYKAGGESLFDTALRMSKNFFNGPTYSGEIDPAGLIRDFWSKVAGSHPELCDTDLTCDYEYR